VLPRRATVRPPDEVDPGGAHGGGAGAEPGGAPSRTAEATALDASVVIPTRNRRASVLRALQAIERQDVDPARFEVLVVDNGSSDATGEAVRAYRGPLAVRLLEESVPGRAAACNAGIAGARGRIVVLLDDDMEPVTGWLGAHLRAHETPGLAVVGAAPTAVASESVAGRHLQARFDRHLDKLARTGVRTFRDVYTGNFSVERERLLALDGFAGVFAGYGNEDGELAIRLMALDVRFAYVGDAIARQHQDKDLERAFADARAKGANAVRLAIAHPGAHDDLALGRPASRRRTLARRLLVRLTRLTPGLPRLVVPLASALAGRRPGVAQRVVEVVLDFAYWLGVDDAARAGITLPRLQRDGKRPGDRWKRPIRRLRRPAFLGTLRRTEPLSDRWGLERGEAIDRHYVEAFLRRHRRQIRGRVLEVGDARYSRRFGMDVRSVDVLDIDRDNREATIVADLGNPDGLPEAAFDCIVATQVLQYVYDLPAAVRHLHGMLAPGGTALVTVPTVSRVGTRQLDTEYWRLTPAGARRLFEERFEGGIVEVEGHGNVLVGIAFLAGMAREELRARELEVNDPRFPVLVAIRATKAAA
jgi:glycosyltransferase involved in cell wall biosynthesis/SAM-dependent methyltransferase